MIQFYLLFAMTFQNFLLITSSSENFDTPNVKTVLFREIDVRRSCWNSDEISLLRVRMIMQDLIPKKIPRDMPYLLEYLRSTEESVVQHSPEGKVRRIMMLALSDVLGGYLQAVAIPMAKESYYAGNIDYATISRLYELLNEMKSRLRTDGGRWSRPVDMSHFSIKVTSLHLPIENSELACKAMFVTPEESCTPGFSRIAIPYLDYDTKPGAVALPLKSRNLYSLKTAASSHIIVRFYILARQCLAQMPPAETDIFNQHFLRWLTTSVIPHLYEEVWYPGFGSVMRIVETVNETEILQEGKPIYFANDTSLEKTLIRNRECGFFVMMKNILKYNTWFVILLLVILLILFLLCCCCCLCMFGNYKKKGYAFIGHKSSSSILNAVLSIYCGLKAEEGPTDEVHEISTPIVSAESSNVYPVLPRQNQPAGDAFNRKRPRSESESSAVPMTSSDDDNASIFSR